MKTFFAMFFAILAAAILILLGLFGWSRLNQWKQATNVCFVQITSELNAMNDRLSRDQANIRRAQDSTDMLEMQRRNVETLLAIKEGQNRVLELQRTLVTLYENKPFGLPLTADERTALESTKQQIQEAEKPKVMLAFNARRAMGHKCLA